MKKEFLIYQSKSSKIDFRRDLKKNMIFGTQKQIDQLFGAERLAIQSI